MKIMKIIKIIFCLFYNILIIHIFLYYISCINKVKSKFIFQYIVEYLLKSWQNNFFKKTYFANCFVQTYFANSLILKVGKISWQNKLAK